MSTRSALISALLLVLHATSAIAQARQVALPRLGYPDGIAMDGATAASTVVFPFPAETRILRGSIALSLDVTRAAAPGSNLQVFVNSTRRMMVMHTPDSLLPLQLTIPLDSADLRRATVTVELRSFLTIARDRCVDERLGSAYVTILPASRLEFEYDTLAALSPRGAWSLLPDTVRVSIPDRPVTTPELSLLYQLVVELRGDNHAVRFVRGGISPDLALDSLSRLRSLVAWRRLVMNRSRVLPHEPTFEQLGFTDLSRLYGYRGTWRFPIDLRALPHDRVPTAIDLDLATAPDATSRGVQFFVYLNGTLLRAITARIDGDRERVRVDLPQYLLTTYNELRVEVQRGRDDANHCGLPEALYPAQILGSSVLRTERATRQPHLFTGTALRLPDQFPLFLPSEAVDRPELFLPSIVSLSRGLWGNRSPSFRLYGVTDRISTDTAFVVFGTPSGFSATIPATRQSGLLRVRGPGIADVALDIHEDDALVQVASLDGRSGIVVSLPTASSVYPDAPENYGNADVVVAPAGASTIRISTRGLPAETLLGRLPWLRRWAWTTELVVAVVVGILLLAALAYALRTRIRSRGST